MIATELDPRLTGWGPSIQVASVLISLGVGVWWGMMDYRREVGRRRFLVLAFCLGFCMCTFVSGPIAARWVTMSIAGLRLTKASRRREYLHVATQITPGAVLLKVTSVYQAASTGTKAWCRTPDGESHDSWWEAPVDRPRKGVYIATFEERWGAHHSRPVLVIDAARPVPTRFFRTMRAVRNWDSDRPAPSPSE